MLQPPEERRIAQQAVFCDFSIPGCQFASGQGIQEIDICQHGDRLVKGTDEVLAMAGVDAGLATDRTVDLRQQRGWYLDETDTAANNCGRKSCKISDDATAEGNDVIIALHTGCNEVIAHLCKPGVTLGLSRPVR